MNAFTNGDIVSWGTPCGINCTYTVVFEGPAYACTDYGPAPLITNVASDGLLYNAAPNLVDPPEDANYTNVTGETQVSNGIWFNRTVPFNNTVLPTLCVLYASTYNVSVTYVNNLPYVVTTIDRHTEIYSSIFQRLYYNPLDNETISFANFYAIEQAVEDLLVGNISMTQDEPHYSGWAVFNSNFLLWNLVNYTNLGYPEIRYPSNFSKAVEDLLINTTLSLMSFIDNEPPPQVYFFNLIPPIAIAVNTSVDVETFLYPAHYRYSVLTLWEIYGIALGIGFICICLEYSLLLSSAVPGANFSFVQVLVTTRNPTLDTLCHGSNLGGDAISEKVRNAKLKFGRSKVSGQACFGLDDEISSFSSGRGKYEPIESSI